MCSCVRTHTYNVQDGQIGWVISLSQLRWISHNLFSLNHIAHWSSLHTKNIKLLSASHTPLIHSAIKISSHPPIHAWTYCNCSLKDPLSPSISSSPRSSDCCGCWILQLALHFAFCRSVQRSLVGSNWNMVQSQDLRHKHIMTIFHEQLPVSLLPTLLYNESRMSNFSWK